MWLSLVQIPIHTHTNMHTLTPTHISLSLSHTHTHTHSLSHTHTLSLSLSLSHTHTHTYSLSLSFSLSLSALKTDINLWISFLHRVNTTSLELSDLHCLLLLVDGRSMTRVTQILQSTSCPLDAARQGHILRHVRLDGGPAQGMTLTFKDMLGAVTLCDRSAAAKCCPLWGLMPEPSYRAWNIKSIVS